MFIPSHFQIQDEGTAYDMISKYGFATLFSQHKGIPCATHLPLILSSDKKCLYGHFARPNPQWEDITGQSVLAVFQGPHCYISPSWYETDKAVPTWNYVSIHVYGPVEIIAGEELKNSLRELVLKYEEPNSSYKFDEVDPGFIEGMTKGIVGFKIAIDKVEGKAKLSQNHPIERQERIIRRLEQSAHDDNREVASLMKENIRKKSQ
ncbi:FMN-binding negative transcriptional regulator [Alicyclobacillus tolerans]|uniref:FMN-binding negative transcriptional regulator n=1 Tax=Alicyclobacillus tolerans TaxID=90970 RepID=UPI001F251156|nr:FMN-binding negative transcriptional regulator [Alicyclobacillus tolerans]MCF8564179.1 FMN-binding negative transcriptional regulator [Alicyclobacillus tolerans]